MRQGFDSMFVTNNRGEIIILRRKTPSFYPCGA
jgi:hypothetical protein